MLKYFIIKYSYADVRGTPHFNRVYALLKNCYFRGKIDCKPHSDCIWSVRLLLEESLWVQQYGSDCCAEDLWLS
jgi:hypothetical protein